MSLNSSVIVAGATMTVWRRGLARTLSLPDRAIVALVIGFAVLTTVLSATLYWIISQFFSGIDPAQFHGDARALLRLVFSGVAFGSLVFLLVLATSTPERTVLDNVLRLLPVRRSARILGSSVPLLALGFSMSFLLGVSSLAIVFRLASRDVAPILALAAYVWLMLWSAVSWPVLFFLVRSAAHRLVRLPSNYSLAVATVVCIAAGIVLVGIDLVPVERIGNEEWWQLLSPTRGLTELLVGSGGLSTAIGWTSVGLWSCVAGALGWLYIHTASVSGDASSTRIFVGSDFPAGRFAARVWLEILVIVRLPQFLVASLVVIIGTLAFPILLGVARFAAVVDQLAAIVVILPAAIGIYSFGATAPAHWLAHLLTGNRRRWLVPKLSASLVVPVVLVLPYLSLMFAAGLPVDRIADVVSLGFAMFVSAALAGIVVPCVPGQALSATITSAATAVLWAILVVGSRWIASSIGPMDPVVGTLVGAGVLLCLIPLVVLRSSEPGVAIG